LIGWPGKSEMVTCKYPGRAQGKHHRPIEMMKRDWDLIWSLRMIWMDSWIFWFRPSIANAKGRWNSDLLESPNFDLPKYIRRAWPDCANRIVSEETDGPLAHFWEGENPGSLHKYWERFNDEDWSGKEMKCCPRSPS
jgi:hypothetical protein